MALRCTRVGFSKLCFATACTRRGSRPSSAKEGSASGCGFSVDVGLASDSAAAGVGSLLLSSLRFIVSGCVWDFGDVVGLDSSNQPISGGFPGCQPKIFGDCKLPYRIER